MKNFSLFSTELLETLIKEIQKTTLSTLALRQNTEITGLFVEEKACAIDGDTVKNKLADNE